MINEKDVYSVGELLQIRRSDERWHLALVQRDEVWDVDRMRRLLDSLLAGYPIGALLLCRTQKDSQIITRLAGASTVSPAVAGSWQLLDGQQRINALYTTLTTADEDHQHYGRFFLNLTVDRPAANPESGRSDRQLAHIVCRRVLDLPEGEGVDDFADRPRCIDLSRLYDWAQQSAVLSGFNEQVATDVASLAARIDPKFKHRLGPQEADRAREWLTRLAAMWQDPKIPVMKAEVHAPEDLLELFARLNRSGIPFQDADIYFAAIKTFWPEAEPSLKRVIVATTYRSPNGKAVPLINMMGALQLVSRVSARALGRGDILPLRVSRIAGSSREAMVSTMGQLTAANSTFLVNLSQFTEHFARSSSLGYAARLVREQLWDEVFAWATVRGTWDDDDISDVDNYLFGASLFAYPTIFGASFSSLSMVEALTAASAAHKFPLQEIISATWDKHPELRQSRRQVSPLIFPVGTDARERQKLADGNTAILLSLAQRIPLDHERMLDVDHIYPSALASRMRDVTPRSRHPERWRVNSSGNKWFLDYALNRSLQDLPPRKKFQRLLGELEKRADPTQGPASSHVWAREQWAIEQHEIDDLQRVDELLDGDIPTAMEIFARLTTARSQRLLKHAFDSLPAVRRFALDSKPELIAPAELSSDVVASVADRLGLKELVVTPASAPTPGESLLPSAWSGREKEIEWVMKEATRRHVLRTGPNGRAPQTQTGHRAGKHGFQYMRWVWLGVPESGTHIGAGLPEEEALTSVSPLWLIVHARTPGYDVAAERLSEWRPVDLRHDSAGTWIPLVLDAGRRWSELGNQVLDQFTQAVTVISNPSKG